MLQRVPHRRQRDRLHVQMVLRRRDDDRLPACVQVPSAPKGRRPIAPDGRRRHPRLEGYLRGRRPAWGREIPAPASSRRGTPTGARLSTSPTRSGAMPGAPRDAVNERMQAHHQARNKKIVPPTWVNARGEPARSICGPSDPADATQVMTGSSGPLRPPARDARGARALVQERRATQRTRTATERTRPPARFAVLDAWWKPLTDAISGSAVGTRSQALKLTIDDSPQDQRGRRTTTVRTAAVLPTYG